MHKHAALTAPVIALITMLALALSASATPANAKGFSYGPHCFARIYGVAGYRICAQCIRQCRYYDPLHCKPGAFCDWNVTPPDIVACMATCVNAKETAQH
jgi:hypothetical protein